VKGAYLVKERDLTSRAVEVLRNVLKDVSFAELLENEQEHYPLGVLSDWQGRLRLPDREISLLLEVKNIGEPRIARNAVNQLLRHQESLPDSYGVFVAPWISPVTAQICREAGIGYLDMTGNCRFTFGTVHIERAGNPNSFAEKRNLRSFYSPKASRVLRVLLHAPRRPWKLQSLAEEAQVSLGQVHKVKSLLADREWVNIEREGIVLSQPGELLSEWARNYSYRRNNSHQYYAPETPTEVESSLATASARSGIRYALAAFSAAASHAPFVRYQRAYAYVEEQGLEELVQSLHLKEVPSGANLILWIPYDEGVWYGAKEIAGVNVASDIQTYLDLHSMHERGEEAARFLLEQEIKPRW
jgi:hypothetical protein